MGCSTFKSDIRKNNKKTGKLVNSMLQQNGNVFYVKSTYATFSTVWTYSKDSIEIHKLAKGKLQDKFKYATAHKTGKMLEKGDLAELDSCLELDGDLFGFKLNRDNNIYEEELPVGIECFTKKKYASENLNRITDDINTYRIWVIKY